MRYSVLVWQNSTGARILSDMDGDWESHHPESMLNSVKLGKIIFQIY